MGQVCSHRGCPNLKPCPKPEHNRKPSELRRGSARERGYDTRWDKYSIWFLQQADCDCGRNHTLCERCQAEGKIEPSEVTDHKIPVYSRHDPLFWDHHNHQGLSTRCHALKTQEDRAAGLTR